MAIHQSYKGVCNINSNIVLCREMNIVAESKPTFYDHTVGYHESPESLRLRIQKKYFRYSPILPKASISALAEQTAITNLIDKTLEGGSVDPFVIKFWAFDSEHKIINAKIRTLSIDVRAGDVVSFNAEIIGKNMEDDRPIIPLNPLNTCSKLITWDDCFITGLSGDISAFSITINNNIMPIYTSYGLFPKDLRNGIQEITGSITSYGYNQFFSKTTSITIKIGNFFKTFQAAFSPPDNKGSASSPFISTSNFFVYT